jgi:hypothetical protein
MTVDTVRHPLQCVQQLPVALAHAALSVAIPGGSVLVVDARDQVVREQ